MPTLTKKQKEIFDFITLYQRKNGVSPTIEEMGRHFRRAVGTIHEHLEGLREKGFIKKNNSARGIEINRNDELVMIPLVGFIAAGSPIQANEEHEVISVPKNLLAKSGEHFALKVMGESMINDGVFDGDTIIARKQNIANNGDMVVALLNREEATLKRFFKEKNLFRLQPANPSFKPIFTNDLIVQGKVVSIIQNFNQEENKTEEFTKNTIAYIQQTDLKHRKIFGQYFTPKLIREALLTKLPNNIYGPKILDPGCGTGEFLLTAKQYFKNPKLYGWDIDNNLIKVSQKNVPGAHLKCSDALENDQRGQYDFVIGNPPYFEFSPTKNQKNKFRSIIGGRVNVFSLFIYQGLNWLKDGGYLAFVVPPSMNNGAYFSKLRQFIIDNSNIEYLKVIDDPRLFHGAQQSVMLLILKKGKNCGDHVFHKNGITIFSESPTALTTFFHGKTTLNKLGFRAKTGSVVWNQNRKTLTNDPTTGTTLIWAHNINSDGLRLSTNPKKPQYVRRNGADTGPAIVVNRITGTVKAGKLHAAVIPTGMEFFAENHVNVILPPPGLPEKIIRAVARQLSADGNAQILHRITGNTQVSKTELVSLFPIDERPLYSAAPDRSVSKILRQGVLMP